MKQLNTIFACLLAAAMSVGVTDATELVRVGKVEVAGTRLERAETVARWTGVRKGDVWREQSEREAAERVLSAYRDRGYWNASIEAQTREGVDGLAVRFVVSEGELTRIGSVVFEGTMPEPIRLAQSVVETKEGDPLRESQVAGDANALADYHEEVGYPYAKVVPRVAVEPGDSVVTLVWEVNAGPRVTVDGIRFSGRKATKEKVLERETGIGVGETYDQRSVDRATDRLRRLQWLRHVAEPSIEQDARTGRYVLHYAIEEEKVATIEGGVGMLPSSDGYDWVGRIRFSSDNLGGTGRGARIFWDRPEAESSDLEVAYREPWLMGQPFHGDIAVAFEQRPGYLEAGLEMGLGYRPATDLEVAARVARSSVRPDSVGFSPVVRQSVWSFGGLLSWDLRDSRTSPTRGYAVTSALYVDRVSRADSGEKIGRVRYESALEGYRSLAKKMTLGLRLNAQGIVQQDTPGPDALIRVGGTQTIRGHLEEHFLVRQAAWVNLELIRRLGRSSRVYLFCDGGVLKSEPAGWLNAVGYGVGLRAMTRGGMLAVEYGLARGEGASRGMVHVRLVR